MEHREGSHCGREDLRVALGALVLDALDADEAREVRRHMADCAECQAEYASLCGVRSVLDAGLLGRRGVGAIGGALDDVLDPTARPDAWPDDWSDARVPAGFDRVPDHLLGRDRGRGLDRDSAVSGRRRRLARRPATAPRQRPGRGPSPTSAPWSTSASGPGAAVVSPRRSSLVMAMAAVTAALLVVATASVFALAKKDAVTHTASQTVAASNAAGVTASIDFHKAAWGTWVQVTMSNVPADYHCTLLVVGTDGSREFASSWSSDPAGGSFTVPGGVAMQPSAIDYFDVALAPGYDLKIPVPRSSTGQ